MFPLNWSLQTKLTTACLYSPMSAAPIYFWLAPGALHDMGYPAFAEKTRG
jgi:hypothetical protein